MILQASEGLLETITDQVLYAVFYELECLDNLSMRNIVTYAPQKAGRSLEEVNYQSIKRAIQNLLTRGLAVKEKGKLKLTAAGRNRLQRILPSLGINTVRGYGEVFLVAYDISEVTRIGREIINKWLRNNKAVKVQQSLYLLIANPQTDLEGLLDRIEIEGQVLIIKLGKDSVVGGKLLKDYLWEKCNMDKLERDYQEFIQAFSNMPVQNLTRSMVDFSFNKILISDPCLPSEFLPRDWAGDKALRLYRDLLSKLHN